MGVRSELHQRCDLGAASQFGVVNRIVAIWLQHQKVGKPLKISVEESCLKHHRGFLLQCGDGLGSQFFHLVSNRTTRVSIVGARNLNHAIAVFGPVLCELFGLVQVTQLTGPLQHGVLVFGYFDVEPDCLIDATNLSPEALGGVREIAG